MSTPYLIPLVSTPQRLSITLAGVVYQLRVYWCRPMALWVLDIADVNANPIVSGIPLVTGIDLLRQYRHLGILGKLIAQTDNNALVPPDFDNLGTQGNLYFVTTP